MYIAHIIPLVCTRTQFSNYLSRIKLDLQLPWYIRINFLCAFNELTSRDTRPLACIGHHEIGQRMWTLFRVQKSPGNCTYFQAISTVMNKNHYACWVETVSAIHLTCKDELWIFNKLTSSRWKLMILCVSQQCLYLQRFQSNCIYTSYNFAEVDFVYMCKHFCTRNGHNSA